MLRLVMRVLELLRGHKAPARSDLSSKSTHLLGPGAKLVGTLCVLLAVAFIADRYFGTGKFKTLFSKKKPAAAPINPSSIPDEPPEESGLQPSTGPAVWERYETQDHICSAEFPGPPKRADRQTASTELHQLLLQREPNQGFYGISQTSAPPDKSPTLAEAVENLRNAFGAVNDHAIKQGNLDGWQLDFNMSDKLSINRVFVWQGTVYRANVVIDKPAQDTPEVKRFFNSIRFDLKPKLTENSDNPADAIAPLRGQHE